MTATQPEAGKSSNEDAAPAQGGRLPLIAPTLLVLLLIANAWRIAATFTWTGGDIRGYESDYAASGLCNCVVASERYPLELLWPRLNLLANQLGLPFSAFHFLVVLASSLLWFCVALRVRGSMRLGEKSSWAYILGIGLYLVSWPLLTAGYVNVLRASVAVPLAVLALIFFASRRWLSAALIAVGAVGIQQPISISLLLGGLVALMLGRKWTIRLFVVGCLVYASDALGRLLPTIGLGSVSTTIEVSQAQWALRYESGVRWDFLLSAIVLMLALLLVSKSEKFPELPEQLVTLAIGLTFPFLLLGTIPFADRLLHGAWNFIPLLLLAALAARPQLRIPLGMGSILGLLILIVWWTFR